MNPTDLKRVLSQGLLSFPVTDFDEAGEFREGTYRERLEWLIPYGASALFAAGGTGEFFSLSHGDFSRVIAAAVDTCGERVPVIAGAGGGTAMAIEFAREAERLGAAGILLFPHYLTEAAPAGIAEHVARVCRSVSIGVVFYNRGNSRLPAPLLAALADRHPNLIGFKDGVGDIEAMVTVSRALGDRLVYVGGLPTAEIYAAAYHAIGVPVYSSAVFNFVPRMAIEFYRAIRSGDRTTTNRLLDEFFIPYIGIRNRGPGYAVSIVKAGARIVGRDAGPVRPPLLDLQQDDVEQLANLITALGPQ
jgi:5-dehydro-4-deoxyglucarate dehydratase